ncbi:LOW QUALITY PROTEIN: hypothetical protein CRUP_016762 [Coryphaenoides rupestris]|nr:LOW QUALITY PROTEIN: hypothetical protein CRUP_016762 [Coryphaenoides rupestris]
MANVLPVREDDKMAADRADLNTEQGGRLRRTARRATPSLPRLTSIERRRGLAAGQGSSQSQPGFDRLSNAERRPEGQQRLEGQQRPEVGGQRLLSLKELLLGKVEHALFQGTVPEASAVGRLSVLALFRRFFRPQLRKEGFLVTL